MHTPHIDPAPKDKSVLFPLPEMRDAMDTSKAVSSVLTAVSEGELTPIEGTHTRVMGLIDSYRRISWGFGNEKQILSGWGLIEP